MSVTYTFKNVHDSGGKPHAEFKRSEITEKDASRPFHGFLAKIGLGVLFARSSTIYACEDLCQDYENALDPVNASQFSKALEKIKAWQEPRPPRAANTSVRLAAETPKSAPSLVQAV